MLRIKKTITKEYTKWHLPCLGNNAILQNLCLQTSQSSLKSRHARIKMLPLPIYARSVIRHQQFVFSEQTQSPQFMDTKFGTPAWHWQNPTLGVLTTPWCTRSGGGNVVHLWQDVRVWSRYNDDTGWIAPRLMKGSKATQARYFVDLISSRYTARRVLIRLFS